LSDTTGDLLQEIDLDIASEELRVSYDYKTSYPLRSMSLVSVSLGFAAEASPLRSGKEVFASCFAFDGKVTVIGNPWGFSV
jgi:hypothetical protein